MHVGHRWRAAPLVVALATVAALAGCNASRPTAAPVATTPGVGPPAEQPGTDVPSVTEPTAVGPLPTQPGLTTTVTTTTAAVTAPGQGTTTATTAAPTGVAPPGPLARPTEAEWAAVDAYLQDELLGSGDFAFGVAVSIDGEPVHAASYGTRNTPDAVPEPAEEASPGSTEPGAPATTTTTTTTLPAPPPEPVSATDRFRVASLSKLITGTVTLELVEAGELGLDEPVGALLGDALGVDVDGRPVASITVRQLLAHTAGFNAFRDTFFGHGVENCREAGARGLDRGVQFDPGTTYQYSNMNFCLLGILIEEVTGQPYEDVVRQRLLAPLGIAGMRVAGTFDPDPDEVKHPSVPTRNYMETLGGAGAWMATPADMVRILDSLDNTKPGFHPLSDEMALTIRQPQPGIEYNNPLEQWYGMALIVYANLSWGHTGTIENTHAIVMHRPDGMTWSILVSGNHPEETDDLAGIFQDALDQAGIDAPAPTTTTTTSTTTTTTAPPTTVPPATAEGATTSSTG